MQVCNLDHSLRLLRFSYPPKMLTQDTPTAILNHITISKETILQSPKRQVPIPLEVPTHLPTPKPALSNHPCQTLYRIEPPQHLPISVPSPPPLGAAVTRAGSALRRRKGEEGGGRVRACCWWWWCCSGGGEAKWLIDWRRIGWLMLNCQLHEPGYFLLR
jgi:hypothetical protein